MEESAPADEADRKSGDGQGYDRRMPVDRATNTGHPQATTPSTMDEMKTLTGRDFDRRFLALMVRDHRDAIDMVRDVRAGLDAGDPLARFIDKTLPVLQKHLLRAQDLLR